MFFGVLMPKNIKKYFPAPGAQPPQAGAKIKNTEIYEAIS